jgi:2'-5' RNA ligase
MRSALEAAAQCDFGTSTITSITLYRSHLSPHGARYEPLAILPFEGAGG